MLDGAGAGAPLGTEMGTAAGDTTMACPDPFDMPPGVEGTTVVPFRWG